MGIRLKGAVQFETRGSRSANFGNLHDFCLQFYTCRQLQILYISLCLIVHYMHIFETAMCILKIEINQEAKLPLGPNRTAPDLKSNLQCLHSTQLAPSFLLAAGGTQEVCPLCRNCNDQSNIEVGFYKVNADTSEAKREAQSQKTPGASPYRLIVDGAGTSRQRGRETV